MNNETNNQKRRNLCARLLASPQTRRAEVVAVDMEARTVELAFSSEYGVERWGGIEVLSHEPSAVDLSRLNDGGAVLDGHNWDKQTGVVERAWIDHADRRGRALVRYSRNPEGEAMLRDIESGIKRHVSVGYNVLEVRITGERNGMDVYTVTRWQPYEISNVPIPADPTVGVGRSLDNKGSHFTLNKSNSSRLAPVAVQLATVAHDAEIAQPIARRTPHTDSPYEPERFVPTTMKRSIVIDLQGVSLPALFDASGAMRTPESADASRTVAMDAAIVASSRVAGAGANVMVLGNVQTAHTVGASGGVATQSVPLEFRNIEAATFGIVGEDEDAPTIALPVLGTSMDWKNSLQVGVRFEIPRSERKKIKPEDLYTEITKALSLGLARAADALLLSAINAAMPDTFSLAKAASRGLRFDELRALVGSAGHGATVNEDGALRVAGIAAELTPDMAETLVGSFNRAGVVVDSEVTVLFERLQKNGHLACTAWASMIPLVPDGSAFWTVT